MNVFLLYLQCYKFVYGAKLENKSNSTKLFNRKLEKKSMSLKARLYKYIEYKGLTTQKFEQLAGLSNGAVSKASDNMRMGTLDKISNTFSDLNIDWLRTGVGEMLKPISMTYYQRIERILNHYSLTARGLSIALGFNSPQIFYDIKSGKCGISKKLAEKIQEKFVDVNTAWLLTGEGEMLKPISNGVEIGDVFRVTSSDPEISKVDFITVAARASFVESILTATEDVVDQYPVVLMENERPFLGSLKVFEVEGESMLPMKPGTLLLTRQIPPTRWNSISNRIAVVIFSEFVVVKRINRNELDINNTLTLHSDNTLYPSMVVQAADIRAVFEAIRIISAPLG